MRRSRCWGLAVILIVSGLAATTSAAEKPVTGKDAKPRPSAESPGLFRRWFATPAKPEPAPSKETAKKPETRPAAVPDEASQERQREEDTLLRRLKVCDTLSAIAFQTRDTELQRLVEHLDDRVRSAYSQRIAHLPISNARFESDEKTVEKHLSRRPPSPGRLSDILSTTSPFDPADRNGLTASRREVRP